MRIILTTMLFVSTTALLAADPKAGDKEAPTQEAVIDMCGGRLAKALHLFGAPVDVFVNRGDKPEDDSVILDFGSFGLNVRNKVVISCYFYQEWPGAAKGIKIGDSRAQVVKVLGDKFQTSKNKAGSDDLGYDLKDNDAFFWVDFDKDDKVFKMEVQLK